MKKATPSHLLEVVTPPSYTMYKYAHLYVGKLSNANSLSLTLEKRKVEEKFKLSIWF